MLASMELGQSIPGVHSEFAGSLGANIVGLNLSFGCWLLLLGSSSLLGALKVGIGADIDAGVDFAQVVTVIIESKVDSLSGKEQAACNSNEEGDFHLFRTFLNFN